MKGKPSINGISPARGSPGIKLTIRGDNLGLRPEDIQHVFIGETDVGFSLHWYKPSMLTVITPFVFGELEIIIMMNNECCYSTIKYHQEFIRNVGPQMQVTFWPEDERKNTVAIVSSGKDAQASGEGNKNVLIDSTTGLPVSQLQYLNNKPLLDSDLQKIYPKSASIYLTDPDFDPVLFLLKYHKCCSLQELKDSMVAFQNCAKMADGGEPIEVMKVNLMPIFECLKQMEALKLAVTDEKAALTQKAQRVEDQFSRALDESIECGKNLFAEVLTKREYADSARNCLSIMQKFQFLFHLPEKISQNISRRQYSQVINDFVRARIHFANSDVNAFQKIYKDVEAKISAFKDELKQKLIRMPIDFEEAKSVIGYLCELEVDFDPAWLCLNNFKSWLLESLSSCYQLYRAQSITNQTSGHTASYITIDSKDPSTRFLTRNRSSTFNASANTPSTKSLTENIEPSDRSIGSQSQPILILRFTNSVCQLLQSEMVEFWRIGNAYVRNQLYVKHNNSTSWGPNQTRKNLMISSRSKGKGSMVEGIYQGTSESGQELDEMEFFTPYDVKTAWSRMTQEVTQMLCNQMKNAILESSHHIKPNVESLISGGKSNKVSITSDISSLGELDTPSIDHPLLSSLTSMINNTLLESSSNLSHHASPHLSSCIREFRKCCTALPMFELPQETKEQLTQLTYDLRRSALVEMLRSTCASILSFSHRETWQVDISDEFGAITLLPAMYEKTISDAFTRCKDFIIATNQLEKPMFEYEDVLDHFPFWCLDAMTALVVAFEDLANQISVTVKELEEEERRHKVITSMGQTAVPNVEQRITTQARALLLLLNNIDRSQSVNNVRLLNLYDMFGYCSLPTMAPELKVRWLDHQTRIMASYVKLRSNWLLNEQKILLHRFKDTIVIPLEQEQFCFTLDGIKTISDHMTVLVGNLSRIHSELSLLLGSDSYTAQRSEEGSIYKARLPSLLGAILMQFLQGIYEELKKWPRIIQLQITLDFQFLKVILPPSFLEDVHKSLFRNLSINANSNEPSLAQEEQEYLATILNSEHKRMQLMLAGFQAIRVQLEKIPKDGDTQDINLLTPSRLRKRR